MMAETPPLSPDPVVIPGQDEPAPASPPEFPSPVAPPEVQPDATPLETPQSPSIPGDETGQPFD